ncbi:bifunctional DNA-formamidopyrimidine glycosylase/DNA-(apurinic or apyrimidinic site) lyase [Leucobacter chinensis]|uniref:bifunctional DNA-formamidopyrimidine glycosylase/DNA-(apurinic or apyrimidinic site) lyase n=1 Tax=Leucobacter chinensis TaxID=2851010 RepID=UPI001C24D233|nr:bifunctional DNA-formamidopyrimidine glycosylase/DNA-(apurinic or apyrimidinic site) lyase [Leucobacter chinensis]
MPELPEVEVIRQGLAQAVNGARVASVDVLDVRALKRHQSGDASPEHDFAARLTGATLGAPARRGKFLWVPLDPGPAGSVAPTALDATALDATALDATALDATALDATGAAPTEQMPATAAPTTALLGHLGMSGQMLLRTLEQPDDRHVRVRAWLDTREHGELRLDFCDQRLFGSLALDELVATDDGEAAGWGSEHALIPGQAAHIARDPLDPVFDAERVLEQFARRRVHVKKALLDQRIVSGIGNIYADEALWLARVHPETPAANLSRQAARRLLDAVHGVLEKALAEGGTSFDELYVNVNGESGYFAHSLNAYGRGGEACSRCDGVIKRIPFAGRSSHFCPRCQPRR